MSNTESQELKIYEVYNRSTGEKHYSVATNTLDACSLAGWQIRDCFVVEVKPRHKPVPGQETLLLVAIPCQTCPFQYGECRKLPDKECPCQLESHNLREWWRQAAKAHLCEYFGQQLKRNDYNLHQKWCPMDKAIAELTHKP